MAGQGLKPGVLDEILTLARWAPSGDNLQQWRVRVDGDRVEVLLDRSEPPAMLDIGLQASLVAVGGFIESIRLAATTVGHLAEVSLATSVDDPVWGTIRLQPGDIEPDPLAAQLTARVSNRKLFQSGSCSAEEGDALVGAASGFSGVSLQVERRAEVRTPLAQAVGMADSVRMGNRRCHEEFHAKVRWNEEELATGTGFHPRTFEIKPHEALALRASRSYGVLRVLDAVSPMRAMAAALARRQVIASGAIGFLVVADRGTARLLQTGAALLRAWLTATERGLAMQVLAVLPLFAHLLAHGGEGLNERERREVGAARDTYDGIAGLPPLEDVILMLRFGRAPPPSARTRRLPAAALRVD